MVLEPLIAALKARGHQGRPCGSNCARCAHYLTRARFQPPYRCTARAACIPRALIADRLAKFDPGNADWQRDVSVSHNKIGDVQRAQGNLPEALKSYRGSLAIADRLAKFYPGNAGWQRDLSVSRNKIGNVLVA